MELHKRVREAIQTHKKRIELIQWAVMAGVASLIYSEYLANIRQKQHPVHLVMVPSIRNVQELLLTDGPMMTMLSDRFIDDLVAHPLFQQYSSAPELEMFLPENIEIMKTIFDLYILENVNRRVPESIARKFDLFNSEQQTFIEDRSLDLFERKPFNEEQLAFIVEETLLQLLVLMPTMKKEVEFPENNQKIWMCDSEVLTIGNEHDIAIIHFDKEIIRMPEIMKLLSFVSNTTIKECSWGECAPCKGPDKEMVDYEVTTGVFNRVYLTKFIGIDPDAFNPNEEPPKESE